MRYAPAAGGTHACVCPGNPIKVLEVMQVGNASPETATKPTESKECCAWTQDAFQVPWMVQVIRQADPYRITRYGYGLHGAYRFESAGSDLIFDCFGNLLDDGEDSPARGRLLPFLTDPFVILVRNHRS